ncbi:hypothetical protein FACS189440_15500 [Bacteroidia bacterium]|nr:hypothetical protein FACS189423_02220 [Bacteroidia bacterium]GHT49553.1 hypothetical protein FACS189440_15500 [Bacteroidia bacterium]
MNGCLRLTKLIVNNPVPVTITSSTFYDADPVTYENRILTNATLFVPKGTLADYQATANWKNFAHIQEMSFFYDLGYGTSEYPGGISPNGKYLVGSPGFLWENKGNGDNMTVHIDGTDDLRSINDDGVMTGNFYDPKFKVGEASIRNGGVYKEGVRFCLVG